MPKLLLLQIGTAILVLLWAANLLFRRESLKFNFFHWLLLIFLILALASAILSLDVTIGIFGKYGRYEGFLTLATYGLIYFLASQLSWDQEALSWLAKSLTFGAAIVAGYGLLQYLGLEFINWGRLSFEAHRSFSTFGNPTLLTGYLVLALPVAAALFLAEKESFPKNVYGGATLLIFAALITTFTRGGWFSGVVAILVFAWLSRSFLKGRDKSAALILVTFLLFLLFTIAVFSSRSEEPSTNLLARGRSILAFKGSIAERLEIWKIAGTMSKASPFLGFGPDNFRLAFPAYETLTYLKESGRRSFQDNAHNYLLQISSTLGLPAAIVFLILFLLLLKEGYQKIQKLDFTHSKEEGLIISAFTAAALGYFVNILFTVNVLGSAFIFWLLLGLLAGGRGAEFSLGRGKTFLRGFFFIFVLLLAGALSALPILFYVADVHFRTGNWLASQGQFTAAKREIEQAMKLNPFVDRYPYTLGGLYLEKALQGRKKEDFDSAINFFSKAMEISPKNIDNYIYLGQSLAFKGRYFGASYSEQAIPIFNRGLEIQPLSPILRYLMAIAEYDLKRFPEAEENLELALRLDPNYPEAYELLGFAKEKLGKKEEALAAYKKALALDPSLQATREALQRLTRLE